MLARQLPNDENHMYVLLTKINAFFLLSVLGALNTSPSGLDNRVRFAPSFTGLFHPVP